jgi:hypothetical protein
MAAGETSEESAVSLAYLAPTRQQRRLALAVGAFQFSVVPIAGCSPAGRCRVLKLSFQCARSRCSPSTSSLQFCCLPIFRRLDSGAPLVLSET